MAKDEKERALGDVLDATAAFTFDGDRSQHDHESGEPQRRDFVRGDDDPRDAALAEHIAALTALYDRTPD